MIVQIITIFIFIANFCMLYNRSDSDPIILHFAFLHFAFNKGAAFLQPLI